MDNELNMTFGELREYLSRIDRYSICMLETGEYKNYVFLKTIPNDYDNLFVYGIGMREVEFYLINGVYSASGTREQMVLADCIEIMLAKSPKSSVQSEGSNAYLSSTRGGSE